MTFQEAYQWLLWHGNSVGRLAKLGDDLSKHVVMAYQDWHADKLNVLKQNTVIKLVSELALRTMTETEIKDLQSRFGYKVDEK